MSKKTVVGATSAGILSSILAFLGMVTCCGMPVIASALAAVGVGASELSFFQEYQGYFMALSVLSIVYGFWVIYFKKPSTSCCSTTSSCCGTDEKPESKPKPKVWQQIILWLAALLVGYVLLMGNNGTQSPQSQEADMQQTSPASQPSCCPSSSKEVKKPQVAAPACRGC